MTVTKLLTNKKEIEKIIKNQVKMDDDIVFGSHAMNAQLHPFFRRQAGDYDVLSNNPKKDARKLERQLDKLFGGDHFFTKPAIHPGTFKVQHRGFFKDNPRDDIQIADFSKGKVPNKRVNKIKVEKLSNIIKTKKKILKDPESKFRHEKDRNDLKRIRMSKALKKTGVF